MAILNVTPDSFYRESRRSDVDSAVSMALRFCAEGADIIDVGGESTRPGASPVRAEEEIARVVPVIERLRQETEAFISVDTQKASVADEALGAGADIVNDVSALKADPEMAEIVAAHGAGLVLMHMRGTPRTMQEDPAYTDVVIEVRDFLRDAVHTAESAGVSAECILVDPGIGFGKNLGHNLALLGNLHDLHAVGRPILLGVSRKSFLGLLLENEAAERLLGTAASVTAGIMAGAHVVRVHDVRAMRDVAQVADAIRGGLSSSRARSRSSSMSGDAPDHRDRVRSLAQSKASTSTSAGAGR
jgi:dihydropteroate synthase